MQVGVPPFHWKRSIPPSRPPSHPSLFLFFPSPFILQWLPLQFVSGNKQTTTSELSNKDPVSRVIASIAGQGNYRLIQSKEPVSDRGQSPINKRDSRPTGRLYSYLRPEVQRGGFNRHPSLRDISTTPTSYIYQHHRYDCYISPREGDNTL